MDNKSSPSIVCILIKQSKTNPIHQGVYIYLGRAGNAICPAKAILSYLALWGDMFLGHYSYSRMEECSLVKSLMTLWMVYSNNYISRKKTLTPTAYALEPPP